MPADSEASPVVEREIYTTSIKSYVEKPTVSGYSQSESVQKAFAMVDISKTYSEMVYTTRQSYGPD